MQKLFLVKAFTWIILLSLFSVFLACSSSSTTNTSHASKSTNTTDSTNKKLNSSSAGVELKFAIGATGGSNYPLGVAITQILQDGNIPGLKNITTVPGGGAAVMEGVHNNQMQMGMASSSIVYDGFKGNPPFKVVTSNAEPIFSLTPFKLNLIVPEKSDIRNFAELKGKKVNVGPNGFSTVVIAQRLFSYIGFKEGDVKTMNLGVTDAVEQFKDGHVDALLYTPSDLYGAYLELAESMHIRQIPIDPELLKRLNEENKGWIDSQWPVTSELYKGLQPMNTLAHRNVVVVNPNEVSDELAYNIVKTIAENFKTLQSVDPSLKLLKPSDLAIYPGDKFHPGAERYFKEQGWLK